MRKDKLKNSLDGPISIGRTLSRVKVCTKVVQRSQSTCRRRCIRYGPVFVTPMPHPLGSKNPGRPHSGFLGLKRFKVPSVVVYALFILVIYSHAALARRQFILRRSYLEVAGRVPPGSTMTRLTSPCVPRVHTPFQSIALSGALRGRITLIPGNFNIPFNTREF